MPYIGLHLAFSWNIPLKIYSQTVLKVGTKPWEPWFLIFENVEKYWFSRGGIPFFLNEALAVIGYSTRKIAKCIRPIVGKEIKCWSYNSQEPHGPNSMYFLTNGLVINAGYIEYCWPLTMIFKYLVHEILQINFTKWLPEPIVSCCTLCIWYLHSIVILTTTELTLTTAKWLSVKWCTLMSWMHGTLFFFVNLVLKSSN